MGIEGVMAFINYCFILLFFLFLYLIFSHAFMVSHHLNYVFTILVVYKPTQPRNTVSPWGNFTTLTISQYISGPNNAPETIKVGTLLVGSTQEAEVHK